VTGGTEHKDLLQHHRGGEAGDGSQFCGRRGECEPGISARGAMGVAPGRVRSSGNAPACNRSSNWLHL